MYGRSICGRSIFHIRLAMPTRHSFFVGYLAV